VYGRGDLFQYRSVPYTTDHDFIWLSAMLIQTFMDLLKTSITLLALAEMLVL
jgi:hypothetical protein